MESPFFADILLALKVNSIEEDFSLLSSDELRKIPPETMCCEFIVITLIVDCPGNWSGTTANFRKGNVRWAL